MGQTPIFKAFFRIYNMKSYYTDSVMFIYNRINFLKYKPKVKIIEHNEYL